MTNNRITHKCPTCGFKHPILDTQELPTEALKELRMCPGCDIEMKPIIILYKD